MRDALDWAQALRRWESRAPEARGEALAHPQAEEVGAFDCAGFTLFVCDPKWEEVPRARAWVKSEALARVLGEALAEEGLSCFYVKGGRSARGW